MRGCPQWAGEKGRSDLSGSVGQGQVLGFLRSAIKSLYVPSQGEAASDDQPGEISRDGCGERWVWAEN